MRAEGRGNEKHPTSSCLQTFQPRRPNTRSRHDFHTSPRVHRLRWVLQRLNLRLMRTPSIPTVFDNLPTMLGRQPKANVLDLRASESIQDPFHSSMRLLRERRLIHTYAHAHGAR